MEIFLLWFGLSVIVGLFASVRRGRSGLGWWFLAMVISPLLAGLLCLILPSRMASAETPTPNTHVKCPDCAELVRREARVCKHCGCKLVPQPMEAAAPYSETGPDEPAKPGFVKIPDPFRRP